MQRFVTPIALSILFLGGCATTSDRPPAAVIEPVVAGDSWYSIATPGDQALIEALPATWAKARAAVPKRLQSKMEAEGPLVDPTAALDLPALPPGPYRCRLVRFGGRAGFASYAPDFCYIDGDDNGLSFTKQTGQNLPGGWLHADGAKRQIFLGTMRTGAAEVAPPYGKDAARDMAGVVERVAPFRWRLVLTRAGRGALLDIYELVPVPPEVPQTSMVARKTPRG